MPGCRRLLTPLPEPWGLPPAVPKKACPYTQLNLATCNLTRVPILRDGHGHLSVVDKPDEQYVVPDSLLLDEVDEEAARKAAGDAALAGMLMGREPRDEAGRSWFSSVQWFGPAFLPRPAATGRRWTRKCCTAWCRATVPPRSRGPRGLPVRDLQAAHAR